MADQPHQPPGPSGSPIKLGEDYYPTQEEQQAVRDAVNRLTWRQVLEPAGWTRRTGVTGRHFWTSPSGRDGFEELDDSRMQMPNEPGRPRRSPLNKWRMATGVYGGGNMVNLARDLLRRAVGEAPGGPFARSLADDVLSDIRAARAVSGEPAHAPAVAPAPSVDRAVAQSPPTSDSPSTSDRRGSGSLRLTAAADIVPIAQKWLWEELIPLGALTLLAGREQVGKSTCALELAAEVTRGGLPGEYEDVPRNVAVIATEDSWQSTIVLRLMAAGADLNRVFKLSAVSASDETQEGTVTLPDDLEAFEELVEAHEIALVILDPLIPRLTSKLDTHRDRDVRQALEPLVGVAQRTGVALLGVIHVNKTATADPLTTVMASRAFSAVPRAVLFAAVDPDEPEVRYLQLVKSNLASTQTGTMTYSIQPVDVALKDGAVMTVGRLTWGDDSSRTVRDILSAAQALGPLRRTRISDASGWLKDELARRSGSAPLEDLRAAARNAQISGSLLYRARENLGVVSTTAGTFPNRAVWRLPAKADRTPPSKERADEA